MASLLTPKVEWLRQFLLIKASVRAFRYILQRARTNTHVQHRADSSHSSTAMFSAAATAALPAPAALGVGSLFPVL